MIRKTVTKMKMITVGYLGTMVILFFSLSGELFLLVVADLGDILQSRCGDDRLIMRFIIDMTIMTKSGRV